MIQKILIAAIDRDGGIGKDGYMPWYYPEDLKLFMNLTMGHTIVMGRKTFDGMFDRGKAPLKGRQNIIVTSQAAEYRSRFADKYSPSQLSFTTDLYCQDLNLDIDNKIFYCGGANIYQQIIDCPEETPENRVDIIYLSRFAESYDCDTFFPQDDRSLANEFMPYIPTYLTCTSTEKILAQKPFIFQIYSVPK
jgi:dihydrofolate reductase